jgi:hypothetical protein
MQRRDGFIVRIKIKDERGNVIDEIEAIAFKGLLALAHEEGLKSVRTTIVQIPTEENQKTAVVTAKVKTSKGVFTGTGDANPANVNRRIAPHILRMAETRAMARAFRLAVNIGVVAIEELAEDVTVVGNSGDRNQGAQDQTVSLPSGRETRGNPTGAPQGNGNGRSAPERFRGRDRRPTEADPEDRRAMTDEQRKLLFRLAFDLGATQETARDRVLQALGVERLEWATRVDASRAIDALKREVASGGPRESSNDGARHGA